MDLRAVLNSASLSSRGPGATMKNPRTGEAVAEVPRIARVQGVVLNACDSANTTSKPGSGKIAESS